MSFNSAPQAHVAAKVGIGFMPVGTYGIGLVFGLPLALGGLSLILLHIIEIYLWIKRSLFQILK